MPGMGPPPSVNRRRRNWSPATTPLPAAGRAGPPPQWPLPPDITTRAKLQVAEDKLEHLRQRRRDGDHIPETSIIRARERIAVLQAVIANQHDREIELWRELWATPQAVAWERLRWTREIAQYTRWATLGESGDMDAAKEARQLADRLGLTPLALARLRWEIVDTATDTSGPATITALGSRRRRLSED
jgi:hypothetical protein